MYDSPSSIDKQSGLMDGHLIAATRFILAISAVLIIDNTSIPLFVSNATRIALFLYIAYSAALYLLAARRGRQGSIPIWACWTDIGWVTLLIALSGGSSSIFFFGFFFAILVASFEWGFSSGLYATIVSAALFVKVSLVMTNEGAHLDLQRFLVRLLYLCVLGYLMAHWGGLKVRLNKKLTLLRTIMALPAPRLGISRLIYSALDRLRAFYDADTCFIILGGPNETEYSLYRVRKDNSATNPDVESVPVEMSQVLMAIPAEHAVTASEGVSLRRRFEYTFDVTKQGSTSTAGNSTSTVATLLNAKSFITVPLRRSTETVGRLYLTAQRGRAFEVSDVSFLIQIAEHLMPVIDNIRLVDRLAAEAADEERQRIARDIHDSMIQPYIGLQMGLVGIRRRLAVQDNDTNGGDNRELEIISQASADLDRLIEMTADGISDLRGYVHGLRDTGDNEDRLMPAVRRYAAKFTQATNILVQVRTDTDIQVNDRLATEVFQIIVEGLSNIRRHTQSARAFIGLDCSDNRLTVRVENDGMRGTVPKPFTPKSIAERAKALGGRAYVETFGDAGTSVIVEIPL